MSFTTYRNLVELARGRAERSSARGYDFLADGAETADRLTYAELDRRARGIGAELKDRGARGKPILILCPPGLDYIAAFFGCLYAGAIATPAYPPDPMRLNRTLPRLRAIVADTGAKIVLTTSPILQMAGAVTAEASDLAALDWVAVDANNGAAMPFVEPSIRPEDVAFLQYTSGSTSDPKGVVLTHANLLTNIELIRRTFDEDERSRGVFWLPPYHDMGLIGGIIEPLYVGADVTLLSPLDFLRRPMFWLEAISKTRAGTSGGPNFAYDLCVKKSRPEERAKLDLSSWTLAFNAAEPVRAETMDAFARAFEPAGFSADAFYACFGLAEGTLMVTGTQRGKRPGSVRLVGHWLDRGEVIAAPIEASAGTRTLVGLGRSPEGKLAIVDPETHSPCTDGHVGEIWVSSPSVASGYWRNHAATEATFQARLESGDGPYLRTGDLGFIREGELYFVARVKDLIIIRGRNHYPQDIEFAAESAHPALRQGCGAAFAIDENGRERLVVVWEVDAQKAKDPSAVIAAIRARIAEKEGIFADAIALIEARSMPKTSSGKIQRHQAKKEYLEGALAVVSSWKAASEQLQRKDDVPQGASIRDFLVERIARGLNLDADDIDPELPFEQYGLDSAMIVELATDLSARLGRELPATLAFNYPTISALAEHLQREAS